MKQKKNIWLHRTRITGLILCTLLVAAYWGLFFYKIAANLPDYYCSMIQHTFLGWFRYALLGLQPLLAAATVLLLLIPKTNLIGLFLAFFLFSIQTTMHGLAWGADWVSPDVFLQMGTLLLISFGGIFLSKSTPNTRYLTAWL
ncbi:hypothetical protein GCM10007415_31390 [Parapedobacter pyrenivorans]|uniref:DoxX-like family protein n=1 Tax=Parapedobacter pyrenivorans TaxID=1305674 RepID=A0A917MC58_9SPHI|nr:hypothetical protein [Parapedobacter pyrenivorans]GGG94066.1 hypothetical protein GCM10007415_31390 [Parapedobacter pyrenivorans]